MVMPQVSFAGRKKVDHLLLDLDLQNKMKIALCIRSGSSIKDWPFEKFKSTVELLAKKYSANFYIVGSKTDIPFAESFVKTIGGDVAIFNFCGRTNLPELGYLLSKSDFFLSVDTGAAHICGAVGTPLVVVFGATSEKHWAPYTARAICITSRLPCYPCIGSGKKCCHPNCLDVIQPQQVYEACCKSIDTYIE